MSAISEKPDGWYLGLRYMQGRGYVACEAVCLKPDQTGADFLFADEILLEVAYWRTILQDWWQKLATGGHLLLWLPDCRHQPIAEKHARVTLTDVLDEIALWKGWILHEADLIQGQIYVVIEKTGDAYQQQRVWRKQPQHLLVIRTGAYGDALMASSVLPTLKSTGWHISLITSEAGGDVLRHDPHIDELIVLRHGQVPEEELPYYWLAWEQRVDRVINLTHSVEGELLKQPSRLDYHWPTAQRRAMCNHSYLRQLHDIAMVPLPYRQKFYATAEETVWARQQCNGSGNIIVWALRGSAVHKWWPYAPQAICQLLAQSVDCRIVLTGDPTAQRLAEAVTIAVNSYYGTTARLINAVGKYSMRQSMALAQQADLVIGPETGLLHAVAFETMPKIVLLSHSTQRNLTEDWVNATALIPTADCYPCHRLHYGHDNCPQDQTTGASACAASITADSLINIALPRIQHHSGRKATA